jgi:hypothetical protein
MVGGVVIMEQIHYGVGEAAEDMNFIKKKQYEKIRKKM